MKFRTINIIGSAICLAFVATGLPIPINSENVENIQTIPVINSEPVFTITNIPINPNNENENKKDHDDENKKDNDDENEKDNEDQKIDITYVMRRSDKNFMTNGPKGLVKGSHRISQFEIPTIGDKFMEMNNEPVPYIRKEHNKINNDKVQEENI